MAENLSKTEDNGVLFADQWNNLDNRKAHYETTGPEIWRDTGGKIDGFICAVGTGGTLAGVSTALKEKNADIVIGCADPRGAAMFSLFTTGEAKSSEGGSVSEGIGLGRVTSVIDGIRVDTAFLVPDEEAIPELFSLVETDGLVLGGSSAINVAGAIRLARDMGPGKTIVTILCDPGARYQSKLYNPAFLRSKDLPVPEWLERSSDLEPDFVDQ
jgi:cysteine synthase A